MILGFFAMVAANAAAILGARGLLSFVKVGKPSIDAVLFLLLRLLLISATVGIAGAVGGLTPLVLGLAGVAALALFVARGAHRGLAPAARPSCDRWVVVVMAVVALRLLLQVWFFAPYNGDAFAYHLPKIAEWIRAGGFTREFGADSRATFPAGFELIETWWVVFLHHDALIEMAGVELLALAGAAAWAIARELGWSEKCASLAALFFVLTPGLHLQATSCLNDGPVAALVAATAAMIVARVHPLLLLIPIGLGTGIKPTFVYALPGLALVAVLARRDPAATAPHRNVAAACALAALGIGAVWYLRNWALFGNPIYPMGSQGIKSDVSGVTLQRLGPSLRSLQENVTCFLDIRVYDRIGAPDPMCIGNFNWGAASFAIGAPALVALLRTEPGLRRIALGLTVSLLTIFTLVEVDPWYARFVLFFPILTSLALARLWERHRWVAALGALALASGFLSTCVPSFVRRDGVVRMARQEWRERAAHPPPVVPDDDSPIGCITEGFGNSYCLYGPAFSRRVVYLRAETIDSLLAALERERVRIFYVEGALKCNSRLLQEGVRQGRLSPFSHADWKGYVVRGGR